MYTKLGDIFYIPQNNEDGPFLMDYIKVVGLNYNDYCFEVNYYSCTGITPDTDKPLYKYKRSLKVNCDIMDGFKQIYYAGRT